MSKKKKSELDEFVEKLQEEIFDEERKTFSEKVIKEYHNPYKFGKMENPSISGKYKGWCGDTLHLFLRIEKNKVIDASFFTDGCGATVACGSMLIKLITDKEIEDLSKITEEDLKEALDGLPLENEHCATLAIKTLEETLKNYKKN